MRLSPALLVPLFAPLLAAAPLQPPGGPSPQEGGGDRQQRPAVLRWLQDPEYVRLEQTPEGPVLSLVGHVKVLVDGIYIRCDNLVAWLPPREEEREPTEPDVVSRTLEKARRFVRELYAEGTVVITEGDRTLRASAVYYDFTHKRGLLLDGEARFHVESRGGERLPLVIRADELRLLAGNRMQAAGARVTTSPFGRPRYEFRAQRLELIRDRPVSPAPGAPPDELTNVRFDAEGNAFYVGGFPVLWVPDLGGDTTSGVVFRYLERLRYSRSNRFGHEGLLQVGDDIPGATRGDPWGHWSLPLYWFSKRGAGVGLDVAYDERTYRGRARTRYQRDRGEDHLFGEPPTRNRGRISWWHRHRLPEDVQLDLELNVFSDRGYYPTFHENDFKQEKPTENLVYLKKTFFNSQVSGLYSARFNDWMTVREYQPDLRFDLVREPLADILGGTLALDTSARLSHVRLKTDEALGTDPRSTLRADLDTLLEQPLDAGPFKLTPFAGVRYTWYQRDAVRRTDRNRWGFTFGGALSLQAFRIYEASGGLFDLDGLRHVVKPELTFRNTVGVDVPPSELVPFDETESLDNEQVIELRVRNLLQTLRTRSDGLTWVDSFIDLETALEFFPNPRDNAGDPWGNLRTDLLVRFSEELQMVSDFEYGVGGGGFPVANAALGYTPGRDLQAYTGFRHFEEVFDAVFLQLNWRPEQKWLTTIESAYDFSEDRGLEHRLTLSRISPGWVLQIGFRADPGEDDYGISLSLQPRLLFDPVLDPGSLASEPRLLFLDTGLGR